jgi:hypothetical protein
MADWNHFDYRGRRMTLQIPWIGKLLPWYGKVIYLTEEEFQKFKQGDLDFMAHFSGKTDGASAPILSAKFWKKGTQVIGKVLRSFETDNGICYTIQLKRPLSVNRKFTFPAENKTETLERVSVGSLKGFDMALQSSGVPNGKLQYGDEVQISCTGTTPTQKGNDQINFDVQVERKDDKDVEF